jgi:hypothetical protein
VPSLSLALFSILQLIAWFLMQSNTIAAPH